jgi:selenocysteine lyase/cysteine desulfurase
MLDVDHSIAVRTGLHCAPLVHRQLETEKTDSGVRFSVEAFIAKEDIAAAIAAIADIAQWSRKRSSRTQNRT